MRLLADFFRRRKSPEPISIQKAENINMHSNADETFLRSPRNRNTPQQYREKMGRRILGEAKKIGYTMKLVRPPNRTPSGGLKVIDAEIQTADYKLEKTFFPRGRTWRKTLRELEKGEKIGT